jgi:hypothetical protein
VRRLVTPGNVHAQTYALVAYRVNSPHGDDNYWVDGITAADVAAEIQVCGTPALRPGPPWHAPDV